MSIEPEAHHESLRCWASGRKPLYAVEQAGIVATSFVIAVGQIVLDGLPGGQGQWQVKGSLGRNPQTVGQLFPIELQLPGPAVYQEIQVDQVMQSVLLEGRSDPLTDTQQPETCGGESGFLDEFSKQSLSHRLTVLHMTARDGNLSFDFPKAGDKNLALLVSQQRADDQLWIAHGENLRIVFCADVARDRAAGSVWRAVGRQAGERSGKPVQQAFDAFQDAAVGLWKEAVGIQKNRDQAGALGAYYVGPIVVANVDR